MYNSDDDSNLILITSLSIEASCMKFVTDTLVADIKKLVIHPIFAENCTHTVFEQK